MNFKDIQKLADQFAAAAPPEDLLHWLGRIYALLQRTGVRAMEHADIVRWRKEEPALLQKLKTLPAQAKSMVEFIQSRLG